MHFLWETKFNSHPFVNIGLNNTSVANTAMVMKQLFIFYIFCAQDLLDKYILPREKIHSNPKVIISLNNLLV